MTISIPSVSTAASDISSNRDFTAIANNITRSEGKVNRVKRNNCDRIITHSLAQSGGLEYTDLVISRSVRMNCQCTAGSTIDKCFCRTVSSVPSVSEVFRIVITQISRQDDISACANRIIGSSNLNEDVSVYINCIRFANASATIGIGDFHSVDVRFIGSLMADGDRSIGGINNIRIEESPLVSNNTCSKSSIIHMSSEGSNTVITEESVTTDNHCRVVINLQSIRYSCGRAS